MSDRPIKSDVTCYDDLAWATGEESRLGVFMGSAAPADDFLRQLDAVSPLSWHGSLAAGTKIAVYGFGSMPVIWRHLRDIAKAEKIDIDWCMILPTPNWRELVGGILANADILDIYRQLPHRFTNDSLDLAGYPGSLIEDIDADKRPNRWLRGTYRLARAIAYVRLFRAFYRERKVTHLLMPTIESSGAKIAVGTAKELGIRVLALTDMRNLAGTCFASDAYETPASYAAPTDAQRAVAARYIAEFRSNGHPSRAIPVELSAEESRRLSDFTPPLHVRLSDFIRHALERPDLFSLDTLRVAGMRNIPVLRNLVRGVRRRRNAAQFDIGSLGELPRKFIYYPLQYTPEASINTPAPYFLDQLRVLDALRYAMPNDCVLVVKEHWACIPVRPVSYIRRIRRLPGVLVVRYDFPSLDLAKRASLTATVTGTAGMEAALLGRPTIVLAPFLPAHAVGEVTDLSALRAKIGQAIKEPVCDDALVERVAKLMSVRYPFFYGSAAEPGEPLLRIGNMKRFLFGLLDHIERDRTKQALR
jgi:hypothetical protein